MFWGDGLNPQTRTEGVAMNLLFRFIRFLAVSAFKLALGLSTVLFRLIVLPFLLATLRVSGRLVFTSLTATVSHPRQFTDRLASQWTQQILELGIPRDNIDQIYSLCQFMAGSTIVLGWVIAALFTVGILSVVIGFFI